MIDPRSNRTMGRDVAMTAGMFFLVAFFQNGSV